MFERYSRQIATGKISLKEQNAFAKEKIAIIGLGAIGSPLAVLLLRLGAKNIIIIDRDFVELSNLQRQSYVEEDIGNPKAEALKKHLLEIDSSAKIIAVVADIDKETIKILKNQDLVLDGTDNMETRFFVNDFCMKNRIPWIYAAAIGTTVTTMNIVPGKTACFECVFEKELTPGILDTCETAGILNSTNTHLAAYVAVEAIKILLGKKISECLYYHDSWTHKTTAAEVKKRKNCNACNGKYLHLQEKKTESVALCGSNSYHIKPAKIVNIDLEALAGKLKKTLVVETKGSIIHITLENTKISLFADGRAIIKNAKSPQQAKAAYARIIGI
ncbi:MAG: ThiF family adenylyltransferase [Candidatus Aenigmarchaeota archaeon]|nr:ThiF family adenylyltransferase [Candidatus Aenigmarchaeota archaeon]